MVESSSHVTTGQRVGKLTARASVTPAHPHITEPHCTHFSFTGSLCAHHLDFSATTNGTLFWCECNSVTFTGSLPFLCLCRFKEACCAKRRTNLRILCNQQLNTAHKRFLPPGSIPELEKEPTLPCQLPELLVREMKARHLMTATGDGSRIEWKPSVIIIPIGQSPTARSGHPKKQNSRKKISRSLNSSFDS